MMVVLLMDQEKLFMLLLMVVQLVVDQEKLFLLLLLVVVLLASPVVTVGGGT